mgnify:FL=1
MSKVDQVLTKARLPSAPEFYDVNTFSSLINSLELILGSIKTPQEIRNQSEAQSWFMG